MTEFDKIIRYNYSPAERGQPVFLTDLGSGSPTPPSGGEGRRPERPERKSLLPVIVVLAVILAGMLGFYLYKSAQPPVIAEPARPGVTCMDDAGGGVYCWKAK